MGRTSSRTLLVLAGILVVLSGLILSPDGRIFCLVIAGIICVAILVLRPSRAAQIVAFLMAAAVAMQILSVWPYYRHLLDGYKNRAYEGSKMERAK